MLSSQVESESIVYGCIKDIAGDDLDSQRRLTNRRAMLALPKAEEWSYICREMFSLPTLERSGEKYFTEVMHFGASYKAIEYEWNEWMKHFEALLDQLYWVSAVVHLETELSGVHTFLWECRDGGHVPGSGRQNIHRSWTQEKVF